MYNLETRYKAVVHYNYFVNSLRRVSKLYGVSKSSLQRWVTKSPNYKKKRNKRQVKKDIQKCILEQIKLNPFITMDKLSSIISKSCNVKKSRRTINRYVQQQKFSLKKACRMVDIVHNKDAVKTLCQSFIDGNQENNIISIDECGFYIGDHRRKGWSAKGKRLDVLGDKSLRGSKFSFVMAISKQGIVGYTILDCNCNKNEFI